MCICNPRGEGKGGFIILPMCICNPRGGGGGGGGGRGDLSSCLSSENYLRDFSK